MLIVDIIPNLITGISHRDVLDLNSYPITTNKKTNQVSQPLPWRPHLFLKNQENSFYLNALHFHPFEQISFITTNYQHFFVM